MSKSNAAAKQRRASISPSIQPLTISQPQQPSSANNTSGLTLQQVISLFDRRIIHLESSLKDAAQDEEPGSSSINNLSEIIDEFNSRFELFAQEIGGLKDTIIKLQTYTMEVNKMLLDERISLGVNSDDEVVDEIKEEVVDESLTLNTESVVVPESNGYSAAVNAKKRGR